MRHLSLPRAVSSLILLALVPGSLAGQLPQPPDEWWTDLFHNGAYPEAVLEFELGMTMTIALAIESIDGTTITLASTTDVMGNASVQSSTLKADLIKPAESVGMLAGFSGASPSQTLAEGAEFHKIEDTTCIVGDLELKCALYEMKSGTATIQVWHAPAIPPVFNGGFARAETTANGQTMSISLKSYKGKLLEE
jgi:hypothetical protein